MIVSAYSTRTGGPGEHGPLDQAFGLELAQPLGEEAVGKPWHLAQHLAEPLGTLGQEAHHGAGPAAPDQLHRVVVARTNRVQLGDLVWRSGCRSHSRHHGQRSTET